MIKLTDKDRILRISSCLPIESMKRFSVLSQEELVTLYDLLEKLGQASIDIKNLGRILKLIL